MNRRQLLGLAGAMGAGMTLGGPHVFADDHGSADDNKMMTPLGNHHLHFCGIHCARKTRASRSSRSTTVACSATTCTSACCTTAVGMGAKLLGVEYIVPDEIFQKLPDEEKKYWHPHTYEVLGGGLIAPEMKPDDEMAFMKGLLLTWGKTWHTWPDPTTPVPMGEPLLMWSLTGDGQGDPKVVAARDKEFGVATADVRKARIEAIGYEVPAVPSPKDLDVIGRQWTAAGEDRPTPRKK